MKKRLGALVKVRIVSSVVILAAACYSIASKNWATFVGCVPFAAVLIPGYFEMLPRPSSSPHWTGGIFKFALIFPLILASVFLRCWLESGLGKAVIAVLTVTGYTIFASIIVLLIVKKRHGL
jgi:hypothetical protein